MRTTSVFDVANRLARATGGRPRVRLRLDGGWRLYLVLPAGLSADAQLTVLDLLAGADRFGHDRTDTAERVWADFDRDHEQEPTQ
ncbi:hypothetical protein F4556_002273 [Kitasatospora gansuensis]|uniref:Uncharacterized protein n=1 Tax=Kitasatospora gansuensis TaxID=258050 RepID=A0A7W7WH39_9ACTN|nr:hypothetical protein [Kitasatospora gansuensis]MBB4946738.1 hypothetical protein [Kitasatospora gansuensis]